MSQVEKWSEEYICNEVTNLALTSKDEDDLMVKIGEILGHACNEIRKLQKELIKADTKFFKIIDFDNDLSDAKVTARYARKEIAILIKEKKDVPDK